LKKFPYHDRLVVLLVSGAVDECDVTLTGGVEQRFEHLRVRFEFAVVALPKLGPAAWIVTKPLA
jgi:hypothetical protein